MFSIFPELAPEFKFLVKINREKIYKGDFNLLKSAEDHGKPHKHMFDKLRLNEQETGIFFNLFFLNL